MAIAWEMATREAHKKRDQGTLGALKPKKFLKNSTMLSGKVI
jgi:hypothetical protein